MLLVSLEDAILLLNKWKEGKLWLGTWATVGDELREEHKFWAMVSESTRKGLVLAGECALLEIKFEPKMEFGYAETSEVPADAKERFSRFDFSFMIRSHSVLAFLFGEEPKND